MAKKRRKKRSLLGMLISGVLGLIDGVCALIVKVAMGILHGIGWVLMHVLRLIGWILGGLLRLLTVGPRWVLRRLTGRYLTAELCLKLDGIEFENYMAQVLKDNGFKHVEVTRASGDQGVDILAERGGQAYAIQCKNYVGAVGNAAVQEAYTGSEYYGCDVAVVVCPGEFTKSAQALAERTGVQLWDGRKLTRMMRASGRRPRHEKKP